MSSSTLPNPVIKVIFTQKIFRFACRSPKDLVAMNSVCKDFEETMQAYHTFNLVLYDNIIKKQQENLQDEEQEEAALQRTSRFLRSAPAWIVYQWTTVNENDETQRELLKKLLLFQARQFQSVLVRVVENEDPSTNLEVLRHILDSCVNLGIAKEVLETRNAGHNCIMIAIDHNLPIDSFKLLLESCSQHTNIKDMLEQTDSDDWNCIHHAACYRLPAESFNLLLELCKQHADIKKMLEQESDWGRNVIMSGVTNRIPADSLRLLLEICAQYADLKTLLEEVDLDDCNFINHAANHQPSADSMEVLLACALKQADLQAILEHCDRIGTSCICSAAAAGQVPEDSLKILIAYFPSDEAFQRILNVKNWQDKNAVDFARTEEMKAFLQDPDCWKKCREWHAARTANS